MLRVRLLVFAILASAEPEIVNDYRVVIERNILKSVDATDINSGLLNLSDYHLTHIDDGAFKNLEITILLLDNNKLKNLHPFTFEPLHKLSFLSLDNNRLGDLKYVFGGLKNLKLLSIQDNNIATLEMSSLYGVPKSTLVLKSGNEFNGLSPEYYESVFTLLKLCMVKGIVKSLEVFDEHNDTQTADGCVRKILIFKENILELNNQGIRGFEENWYRLDGLFVESLDLRNNNIARITGSMLNHLPENLNRVDLTRNKIKFLKNGVIDNRNLRELGLRYNDIEFIHDDAFTNTENINILLPPSYFWSLLKC